MRVAGFPFWLMAVALVGVPVALALFFGLFTFDPLTPLVFKRAPHRDFPSRCPSCGARDWNV